MDVNRSLWGASLALICAACSGQIGAPGGGSDVSRDQAGEYDPLGEGPAGGSGGSAASGGGAGAGGAAGDEAIVPAEPRLRRLTLEQYRNSIQDLFRVTPDTTALTPVPPLNGLEAIGSSSIAVAEIDVEGFELLADSISAALFDDATARMKLVGCDAIDASCADGFVTRFGRLIFRRPLTDSERDRYLVLLHDATTLTADPWLGLRVVTSAWLQSPNFLYRSELGEPDPANPDQRLLGDYELATRLSFLLWNTTPDEELLDAAEAAELTTSDGLRAQARRLLGAARAGVAMEALFRDYLQLGSLDTLDKLPDVFPQMSNTLGPAMAQETTLTLRTLAFDRDLDFRDLFTSTTTFVNAELARLYAIPEPASAGFEEVQLPADGPRAGLLTQASFLATHAHPGRTSPTRRGKFVRESFMCQGIAPPPPGVNTTLPDTSEAKTMREKLALHASDTTCASCHAIMDPPGLGLENFDAIGAYRETENGVTIDASGVLDSVPFDDARSLGQALADNPAVPSCFARTLLRFARGQVENSTEDPWLDALSTEFVDGGYRMRGLLEALVMHPSFRQVGAVQ